MKEWIDAEVCRRLMELFGRRYHEIPVYSRRFSSIDVPNVQRGIEALARAGGYRIETHYVQGQLTSPQLKRTGAQFQSIDIDVDKPESFALNPVFLLIGEADANAAYLKDLERGRETHVAASDVDVSADVPCSLLCVVLVLCRVDVSAAGLRGPALGIDIRT
ncbi:MAG: hypothetical protein IT428_14410 [Planctomycetaceae bacterium]|nr:hypothetical protein [Planctomycetaceae bacterium]